MKSKYVLNKKYVWSLVFVYIVYTYLSFTQHSKQKYRVILAVNDQPNETSKTTQFDEIQKEQKSLYHGNWS